MSSELLLSEKAEMVKDLSFEDHEDYKYKINATELQKNIYQDSYREQLVSFFQMAPLIKKTVPLEEADYILYANPTARVQDFTDSILEELASIDKRRKPGSEIIICGKACNIKPFIEGKYANITYVPSHYAEYVGKRFEIDMKEEYVVYDDRNKILNIWPVDGCLNKCTFCRRSYMEIPFESQELSFLRERLDWFKEHHPEQMEYVSLRAENLTQYGIDINNKKELHKVIELIESYDEVKYISIAIGLCLEEFTKELVVTIGVSNKIIGMSIYPETGSDRLLKLTGKKHDSSYAKRIINAIKKCNPYIEISAAFMIGLPTETLEEVEETAKFINECNLDHVYINYYGCAPRQPLAKLEQHSDQVKRLHLKHLIKYLKENYNKDRTMVLEHESFYDSSKRSVSRRLDKLRELQKITKGRLWYGATYEYFVGNNMIVKSDRRYLSKVEINKEIERIGKQRKLTSIPKIF